MTMTKKALTRRLRGYLLAGFLVLAPVALAVWVLDRFVLQVDGVLRLIPSSWIVADLAVGEVLMKVPGLGLLLTLALVACVGALARTYAGRRLESASDLLFNRIPLIRTVYSGTKQMLGTLLSDRRSQFGRVVLVEYPRLGMWSMAFVSAEGFSRLPQEVQDKDVVAIFIPTTPNPTSGLMLYVPREDLRDTDLSIDEAFQLIMSFGVAVPGKSPTGFSPGHGPPSP